MSNGKLLVSMNDFVFCFLCFLISYYAHVNFLVVNREAWHAAIHGVAQMVKRLPTMQETWV